MKKLLTILFLFCSVAYLSAEEDMSALLIRNIFFDKAPMHDGAMIIRSKRVYAAGCYLPLSNADVNKDLGTRHRAALGLSEVSDAIVIVISEETGTISIAFDGELVRGFDAESLKAEILKYTLPSDMPRRAMAELGVTKKIINKKAKKSKNKEEENE